MDKIFLVDKDINWTSNDVVIKSKGKLHTKRVGHCGTLDPFATGLLILCSNKATKIVRYLEEENKTYTAKLKLGEKSLTADTEGEIIERKEVPLLNNTYIIGILNKLIGKTTQIPPMYSAVKKDGLKLYEYARMNIEVERVGREIEIFDLKLLNYDNETKCLDFEVTCSKGTYVRTLGESIAEALGTVGYLIELRRTKVGLFDVKDAIKVDDISYDKGLSILEGLRSFEKVVVNDSLALDVKNGKKIVLKNVKNEKVCIVDKNENVLALYELDGFEIYKCMRGLWGI